MVGAESVDRSVLEAQGNDTTAGTVLHDQVEGEVLNEELGVVFEGLTVEGVEDSVSGTIGGSTTTVSLSSWKTC